MIIRVSVSDIINNILISQHLSLLLITLNRIRRKERPETLLLSVAIAYFLIDSERINDETVKRYGCVTRLNIPDPTSKYLFADTSRFLSLA